MARTAPRARALTLIEAHTAAFRRAFGSRLEVEVHPLMQSTDASAALISAARGILPAPHGFASGPGDTQLGQVVALAGTLASEDLYGRLGVTVGALSRLESTPFSVVDAARALQDTLAIRSTNGALNYLPSEYVDRFGARLAIGDPLVLADDAGTVRGRFCVLGVSRTNADEPSLLVEGLGSNAGLFEFGFDTLASATLGYADTIHGLQDHHTADAVAVRIPSVQDAIFVCWALPLAPGEVRDNG